MGQRGWFSEVCRNGNNQGQYCSFGHWGNFN